MDESTGLNLLRSILMAAGGAGVAAGYVTSSNATAIIGGVVALAAAIWEHYSHASLVKKVVALRARLGIPAPR